MIAAALLLSGAAHAEDHTASWFAAHPAEMGATIRGCLDDPGHARQNPNCENATQGGFKRSADEARAHVAAANAQSVIDREANWRAHPQSLLTTLKTCNALLPETRSVFNCAQAFALAQQMVKEMEKK
jgi:hypothetical protein